jgi:hypothetical protein
MMVMLCLSEDEEDLPPLDPTYDSLLDDAEYLDFKSGLNKRAAVAALKAARAAKGAANVAQNAANVAQDAAVAAHLEADDAIADALRKLLDAGHVKWQAALAHDQFYEFAMREISELLSQMP